MRYDQLVLSDMFRRSLHRFGQREAVSDRNGSLTYSQLGTRAVALAHKLAADGVGPGDKVVLLLRNSIDYVVADLAIIFAGACKVPLNDMLAADDVGYMIGHSGAKAVIAHSSFTATISAIGKALAEATTLIGISDNAEGVVEPFQPWTAPDDDEMFQSIRSSSLPVPKGDDPGLIIYTGGTTGRPKGVYHTQQSLAVNFTSHLINAEISADERLLICSPMPHSAQQFVLSALLIGAHITIEPGFDPQRVLQLIESQRLSWMFMVPTMIYRLLDHPQRVDADTSSLRTVVYGASPITPARLREGLAAFGPVFLQIYGQTEIPNLVTTLAKSDHGTEEYQSSCGQPVMFCDVAIRDQNGAIVPSGSVGEITVRSFYTLERYHEDAAKTDEAYIGEYLKTGDVGYMADSGHLYLVDRAKDMIISGGMNVYSSEVENVVQEIEGVGQVVVIGLPDDDWGEAVTAFVIPAESGAQPDKIIEHCKASLAKYKVPKRVELVSEIPLTAYGKPDKKALRALHWGGRERQIN